MSKPIVHDVTSCEPINWKVSVINVSKLILMKPGTLHALSQFCLFQVLLLNLTELTDENARKAMEKFSRTIRSLQSC